MARVSGTTQYRVSQLKKLVAADSSVFHKLWSYPTAISEVILPKQTKMLRQQELVKQLSTDDYMQACSFLTLQERVVFINQSFPSSNLTARRLSNIYKSIKVRKKMIKKGYKRPMKYFTLNEDRFRVIKKDLNLQRSLGKRVIFCDECAWTSRIDPKFAWSNANSNVLIPKNQPRCRRVNLIAGVSLENGLEGFHLSHTPSNLELYCKTINYTNTKTHTEWTQRTYVIKFKALSSRSCGGSWEAS